MQNIFPVKYNKLRFYATDACPNNVWFVKKNILCPFKKEKIDNLKYRKVIVQ